MTVQELIESLQKLDPDLRVFVDGYEHGFSEFEITGPYTFELNVNKDWWSGPHEINKNGDVKAIVLKRPKK